MQDRIPLYPGRVQLIPVDGQENTFDLVRADQATQVGDPLNKGTLLSDASAARQGLGTDAVPDDMWDGLVPVGGVIWLASLVILEGFLVCDGSAVSRTDYAKLFEVIGTTFGAGDGSTTFLLPDLRAKFVRGAGKSGSYSATFGANQSASYVTTNSGVSSQSLYTEGNVDYSANLSTKSAYYGARGYTGTSYSDGPEYALKAHTFRPYNIALTPIIKY